MYQFCNPGEWLKAERTKRMSVYIYAITGGERERKKEEEKEGEIATEKISSIYHRCTFASAF